MTADLAVSTRPGPSSGVDGPAPRTVDALVRDARRRFHRLPPHLAALAVVGGALLVDIRPVAQRAEEGCLPGAVVIERNVLEWRLDPVSPDRIAQVTGHDQAIVVFCSEGYASSLAAASLVELGLRGATDLIGGFQAWRAAGLPVVCPRG
ncbi:MAG TPA: rhodanese-like domain-containing protein [Acidimicrobiales bacterium]